MSQTKTVDSGLQQALAGNTEDRYLVFTVNEQDYAVEISFVTQIIELAPITRLPGMPACLKGVINLRGTIVPVMDMRLRFGFAPIEYHDRTCIIVIDNAGVGVGLIVDSVQGVMDIPKDHIAAPSSDRLVGGKRTQYVKGVGMVNEQLQLLLDCDQIMDIHG